MADTSADLSDMRKPYNKSEDCLVEELLPTVDPFELFHLWFEEAKKCESILEPNAVCLSTCSLDLKVSSRMVLLKSYSKANGFVFFTNYESRKGKALYENPQAALLFYWEPLKRQVRIEGDVFPSSPAESEKYFEKRPRSSQISACCSKQSQPINSRDELLKNYKETDEKYNADEKISRPSNWGGYNFEPRCFEFWQGQSNRLHDRIVFFLKNTHYPIERKFTKEACDGWLYARIQP